MKKHLILIFCWAYLSGAISAQDIFLIPQPVSLVKQPGQFTLTSQTAIGCITEEGKPVAEMLVAALSKATGYQPKIAPKGGIQLVINTKSDPAIGNEGYTLNATTSVVTITANTPAGLFYGAQTLLQLFPPEIESLTPAKAKWTVPAVKITDYPRFPWRGLMLDVSRHFFSVADVERYIDRMARYKYNVLHWHLTDDNGWRIEIKAFPKLTQVGGCRVQRYGKFGDFEAPKPGEKATDCGFYTQDQVREIVAYAAARQVTIVPEIDVPGHCMAALEAYPELSCTHDPNARVNPGSNFAEWYGDGTFKMNVDNTFDPSNEAVYTFMDKVMTEVADLFPNPYIHCGGDECYTGFWERDANCQALMKKEGMKNGHELHGYFMRRMEKIVLSKGKKFIGWDEILEGGVGPTATVMSWRGIKGGIEAAKAGHEVVMTPNDDVYIDLIQGDPAVEPDATAYKMVRLRRSFDFEPVPEGIDSKYIIGGEANLWSEKIPTIRHAEYMTWPRSWALADSYWSPKGTKNWPDFIKRMEHHFERSDLAGFNYARSAYDAIVLTRKEGDKLVADISTEIPGLDIYYTVDETQPDQYTAKYSKPIELPPGDINLKVLTYRDGKPIGRTLILSRAMLEERVGFKLK